MVGNERASHVELLAAPVADEVVHALLRAVRRRHRLRYLQVCTYMKE